jgi:hypothetical protein
MCTVTFVPVEDGCLITSNRDEKLVRKPALPPKEYLHGASRITYPKDAQAGGTWVALKQNGDAAVLLNGGFIKHQPQPPYAQSRGIVFIDIFKDEQPVLSFTNTSLNNIEPFTLILFIDKVLTECRWDGQQKHIKHLPNNSAHIWCSVTLYSDNIIKKRERWFKSWVAGRNQITENDIYTFHRFDADEDNKNGLVMKNENGYQTVSITVLTLLDHQQKMSYHSLANNTATNQVEPTLILPYNYAKKLL